MAPPTQWLPGWVRWPLRLLLWPFVVVDVAAQNIVERVLAPAWRLQGACDRRGACCRHVLVGLPNVVERIPVLRRLAMAWFTQVHGFYERGFSAELERGSNAVVMGCRYLREDGGCAHYHLRPGTCRRYPRRLGQAPTLLPGCGYHLPPPAPSRLRVLP